jgi:hypothetical protein
MPERISLFDTTLRDGAQTQGVDFSVDDKSPYSTPPCATARRPKASISRSTTSAPSRARSTS